MSKKKLTTYELDDEFWAQLDFLRADYDHALEIIDQQKNDIRLLLSILVKEDIPIPEEVVERYIRKVSDEELPFD